MGALAADSFAPAHKKGKKGEAEEEEGKGVIHDDVWWAAQLSVCRQGAAELGGLSPAHPTDAECAPRAPAGPWT